MGVSHSRGHARHSESQPPPPLPRTTSASTPAAETAATSATVDYGNGTGVAGGWAQLDDFLLGMILYRLPHVPLLRAGLVCRKWHCVVDRLVTDLNYWKMLCELRCDSPLGAYDFLFPDKRHHRKTELTCKDYRRLYATYLRPVPPGVKLLMDPYRKPPFNTPGFACSICSSNYLGSLWCFHCDICQIYDLCLKCFERGKSPKHDCIEQSKWWMSHYHLYCSVTPELLVPDRVTELKSGATSGINRKLYEVIDLNFS